MLTETIQKLEALSETDESSCRSSISDGQFIIEANKLSLIEFAIHLLKMADKEYFEGIHQHLDEANFLDEPSVPIVVVRNDGEGSNKCQPE